MTKIFSYCQTCNIMTVDGRCPKCYTVDAQTAPMADRIELSRRELSDGSKVKMLAQGESVTVITITDDIYDDYVAGLEEKIKENPGDEFYPRYLDVIKRMHEPSKLVDLPPIDPDFVAKTIDDIAFGKGRK